jgi:protein gp37
VSLEPLLGPINIETYADRLDWVIVGGESGHGARPMHPDWVRSLRDECLVASVPFMFKQWGGVNKKAAGRELDGRVWDQFPGETSCAT